MTKKTIVIISSNRAEYGILKPLINCFVNSRKYSLKLMVSGSHVSKTFGETYKEIERDGYKINSKIDCLIDNDTPASVLKSMSILSFTLADRLESINPDAAILLGDRFETHAAASSLAILNIPIIHIQGGEVTLGAIDDKLRHSITKLSYLHFTFTEEYKRRVIQMGEAPSRVFNSGALNGDSLLKVKKINKKDIEKELKFKIDKNTVIVTFHSVTTETNTSEIYIDELLKALIYFKDMKFIFTKTNPDADGRIINSKIDKYVKKHQGTAISKKSLGHNMYINLLKYVTLMIGNSSSGIIETPFLKLPTINIGNRQDGRIKPKNIIDAKPTAIDIKKAINKSLSKHFLKSLKKMKNPYYKNNSAKIIFKKIDDNLHKLSPKKEFYDLNK